MNFITGGAAAKYGAETVGVRPEHLRIAREGEGWPGKIAVAEHLGSDTFVYVDAGALGSLTARHVGELGLSAGDAIVLSPDPARIHRFDKDGKALRT
jgi:multiple sugar transport system ATP-binding protein